MAFTKVLGPGIHTLSNITSHNINSSGIVTAVSFVGDGSSLTGIANTDYIVGTAITMGTGNFTGNLTVGGVLTYEDVKNVDSIGVVTARNGIDCNGDLDVDGHTELDNGNVSGVVTFTGTSGNAIRLLDNRTIQFGSAAASRTSMYYDSSASRTKIRNFNDTLEIGYRTVELHYINQARLTIAGSNTFSADANTSFMGDSYHASWVPSQNKFQINDNAKLAFGSQADATILHNNANLLISNTTGIIDVTGNVELNNDLDVDGHTNLDNVSVAGVTTFTGSVGAQGQIQSTYNHASQPRLYLSGISGSSGYNYLLRGDNDGGSRAVHFVNGSARSADNGANTYTIRNDNGKLHLGRSNQLAVLQGSTTYLQHGTSTKLQTSSTGVTVTGTVAATSFTGDGSNLTGISGVSIANQSDNRLITATGTTDALNAESGLTYNGTTLQLAAADDIRIAGGSWTGEYTGGIKIQPDASNAYFQYHGSLFFRNSGGANRLQLDSGGNATFTGSVTATGGFSGSGASLSSVNAATLANVSIGSLLRSDAADSFNSTLTYSGSAGGVPIDFASNDGYPSVRVIRNNTSSGSYADGMYIGYSNQNNGVTRIYGGGATSGALTVNGASDVRINGNTVWNAGNDGSGSGLDSDTVDGIHASSFLRSDVNDAVAAQRIEFRGCDTNNHDTIATSTGNLGSIEIYNYGVGNDAFMAFHAGADYALYFGLDADTNKLAVGGWSMGSAKYAIYHEGNKPTESDLGFNYISSNSDDIATHRIQFQNCATDNNDTIATSSGSQGGIEIYNSGSGNDAFMAFHAGSDFALYFGLDADTNDLSVGGWSMGSAKYRVWHAGNDGNGSGLDSDTVDGIQASSFLRSDANDTATGQITLQRDSSSTTDFSLHIRNQQSAPAQIKFSNNSTTQNGYFFYDHRDAESNSAGNSFHFNSDQSSTAVIIDQTAGNSGFYVGTNRVLTEADLPSLGTKITATGGSTSTYSNHKIHDFTSNGTFEITAGAGEVEVLIVAGGGSEGGAGSGCHAGGGGGGGGIVNRFVTLGIGKYSVVVGSGGGYRNNGGNSSAFGLVALGGGAGGPTLTGNGNNGGSGGGSSRHTNSNQGGVATQPSSDAGGLGNNGGGTGPTNTNPGGGGGAGGAGTNGNGGGVGGAGKQFTQFNNNTYFGAGGNGNTSGGSQGQTQGSNHGAANTGAGGGGSSGGGTRYSGGSGRVMIRYPV